MSNLHYTFYKEYYQYLEMMDNDKEIDNKTKHNNFLITTYTYKEPENPSAKKIPNCGEPIHLKYNDENSKASVSNRKV